MQVKEITDVDLWEKLISDYSPQSFFQSWLWGEITRKTQLTSGEENNVWRFGLYQNNKLEGIFQGVKVIARRGTFLHLRHGPILKNWDKSLLQYFVFFIRQFAKTQKADFVRLSPLIDNTQDNKILIHRSGFINSPIHQMDGEYCWLINLLPNEDEIFSQMRKTTRYLIRQAGKMGVEIVRSTNIQDVTLFLDLYHKTSRRQKFVEHPGIDIEIKECLKNNCGIIYKGYYQKKLLSVALIIYYQHQAIYHHSASIEQKVPVNYLLQWEIIKDAKNRGLKIYNMWGVAPENKINHPWKGLSLFKRGFGGKVKEYLHSQDLPLSIKYCATYSIETWRKIRRGY